MAEYFGLLLIAVAVAWCGDNVTLSAAYRLKRKRLITCTAVLIILLAGFAGLRTRCNDTGAYRRAYELINEYSSYSDINTDIGDNPLFNIINLFLKKQGVPTQSFLMFWAFVTMGCYVMLLHKYSASYSLSIFLLFTTGCYGFVFAGIKQAAAMGLCAIAVIFALKKKWLPYLACIALATGIHPYSLLYLIVPFMQFKPCGKKTALLLGAAVLGGFMLRPLIGTIINITTLLGEEYTAESFTQEGVNIFRVLVCNVPTLLAFLYRRRLFEGSTRQENLMVNLAMINGAIMFIAMFGTANYFARLANYFILFQSLSLPWMLKKIGGRDSRILTALMIICYLGYFYYANVIAIPFENDFARISLNQYLEMLGG